MREQMELGLGQEKKEEEIKVSEIYRVRVEKLKQDLHIDTATALRLAEDEENTEARSKSHLNN